MKYPILLFISIFLFLHSFSQAERRFQIWNKNDVLLHPWNKVNIEVAEIVHYQPKINTVDLKYAEFFLLHKPKNWFEYGGGFRLSQANTYPGWLQEKRPMFFFDVLKNIHDFKFRFSNRFEYRDFKVGASHFRHKQSLTVNFPAVTPMHLNFYISEESFYKLNGVGTHLARLYTGISTIKKEHFNMKVYYALEKYKLASWNTSDIAGVNLYFVL